MSDAEPDVEGLWTAIDRIGRLNAERKALPLLSLRRWRVGRELRRVILAAPVNRGAGQ